MASSKHYKIELDNFWPYQVVVLADQISRHTLSVVRRNSDLNLSQWRVLAAVAEKPGRSAAEVTDVTPMDKTIVSRAVASLIDVGLIKKTQTVHDKRRLALTVTEAGQAIYHDISAELNGVLGGTIAEGLSPEKFVKTLKQFSQFMDDQPAK